MKSRSAMADSIFIRDLEVWFHVGVPDKERARAQRLLLTIEMQIDFEAAARTDDIGRTVDYFAVTQRLLNFGEGRSWRLIETLAVEICEMILGEFRPENVTVEIQKFVIPETRCVSVRANRPLSG